MSNAYAGTPPNALRADALAGVRTRRIIAVCIDLFLVSLLVAALYFRQPTAPRHAVVTALAAVASIWNLDTGLVLWASWLGTLVVMASSHRDFFGAARHLLIQALVRHHTNNIGL